MVRHKKGLKYIIDEFIQKNDAGGLTNELVAYKAAVVFQKAHPHIKNSIYTIEKYVVHSRAGKIEPYEAENLDSIVNIVNKNAETAYDTFVKIGKPVYNLEPELTEGPDFEDPLGETIDFPGSWSEINEPYTIQGVTNLGVCNDIHLPYHDKFAVQACFAEFKRRNVDGIYLNGDIMDMENVSRFEHAPNGRYLKDEIDVGRAFLKSLRKMFPNIPIYWKDGNHEKRLESYITSRCEELANLYGMDIPTLLQLQDLDITYVPEQKVSKFGNLWIAHGHELGLRSGTVNIARQVRMRVGVNIIFGHWHKNQTDSSRNLADEIHSAWAVGSLCYLKPRYTGVLNQWTQGGATVQLHENKKSFTVHPFQIQDGVVI
jgi:predicted phosphodiesterase